MDDRPAPGEVRRFRRRWFTALAALVAAVTVVVSWMVIADRPRPDPRPQPVPGALDFDPGHRYPAFGPDSVFRVDISDAPLAPNSAAMAAHLRDQITPHYGGVVALNTGTYNPSLYVVDASTPRTDVTFDDCQDKGYTPPGLRDGPGYFNDVPIPTDALPAKGSDSTLTLWSPESDQLWEFWIMKKAGDKWSACWGGRIDDVSANRGIFPFPYGTSASGLVTVGSMVTLREAAELRIDHAIGLGILSPATWNRFSFPANRSDGSDASADAIPLGSRLRLDPSVDVDSLGLTPIGTAIARAAQTYGFIAVDSSGGVAVVAESGIPYQGRTGTDPWTALLRGVPNYSQLKGFPWDKIQVIEKDYGKPAGSSTPSS